MDLKPKTKLKAIGFKKVNQIDPVILNEESLHIFKDPEPGNIRKTHGAQYYSNFLDDLRDAPQLAKWKPGQFLVFILITPLNSKEFDIGLIQAAFEAFYLNLKTVVLEESLHLVNKQGKYFLENAKFDISHPIMVYNNEANEAVNLSSNNVIKAQRALLAKYLAANKGKISNKNLEEQGQIAQDKQTILTTENVFSSISFIENPIILECSPDNIITGRANGYQGAVIGLHGCGKREIVTTALHECLHIFSIHHCVWWDCIMNFSYEFSANFSIGGSIHLCPSCLVKMRHQLGFDVLERYKKLHEFFKQVKYTGDAQFVQKVMKTLKNIE